jgi:hypothetical protein
MDEPEKWLRNKKTGQRASGEHCDCGTKLAVITACDISMNNEKP